MNIYEGNDLRDILRYHKFVSTGIDRKSRKRLGGVFAVSYALAYLKSSVEVMVKRLTKREKINFRYTVEVDGVKTPMNVTNSDTDEVKHARRPWIAPRGGDAQFFSDRWTRKRSG